MNPDVATWQRAPGAGKYARLERERRFLVATEPPPATSTRLVEDHYLLGTTLRLRRVTVDGASTWKLTQKVRADPGDPAVVATTNTYLTADEHARLLALPSSPVSKTRSVHLVGSTTFVVDTFHGPLAGLRLAEVEVASLAEPVDVAPWLGLEVTHDDRYSGGRLAAADAAQIAALLRAG